MQSCSKVVHTLLAVLLALPLAWTAAPEPAAAAPAKFPTGQAGTNTAPAAGRPPAALPPSLVGALEPGLAAFTPDQPAEQDHPATEVVILEGEAPPSPSTAGVEPAQAILRRQPAPAAGQAAQPGKLARFPRPAAAEPAPQALSPRSPVTASPPANSWTTLMAENFEGAFPSGLWTAYDQNGAANGDYHWGANQFIAYEYGHSAWPAAAGASGLDPWLFLYPPNLDSWMVYGPVDLSDAVSAELAFHYWNYSEQGGDYFSWLASIDGVHFYGYQTSGLSGPRYAWTRQVFDLGDVPTLGSLLGKPAVWVAFRFTSDGDGTVYDGPFVDAVTLRKYAPAADLLPAAPPGWAAPLIPDTSAGTRTPGQLYTHLKTYIDWSVKNTGATAGPFRTCLYLDGRELTCWTVPGLSPNAYATVQDWVLTATPLAGSRELKLVIDVDNQVSESDESNNTWQMRYTWHSPTDQPDLLPFIPTGWDQPVVTSSQPGTHTTGPILLSDRENYIDWAAINNSDSPALPFSTCLYLDGREIQCWDTAGLGPGLTTTVLDWPLEAELTPGAHTLRLVVDAFDAVAEANEGNNTWQKTFEWTEYCANGQVYPALTAGELFSAYDQAPGGGSPAPPEPEPYRIDLQSRRFKPAPGAEVPLTPQGSGGAAPDASPGSGARSRVLLQLYSIPTPAEQAALAGEGIRLLQYVPDRAWIASIDNSRLAALASDPRVRWIGPLEKSDRIAPLLGDPGVLALIEESGSEPLPLLVEFAGDVPLDAARRLAEQQGAVVVNQVETIHALLVTIPADRWSALAGLDEVLWIEPPLPAMDPLNDCVRDRIGGDALHRPPYDLDGSGVDLLIYDAGTVDPTHEAFAGRLQIRDDSHTSDHATHVAGTAAGADTGMIPGRNLAGLAPGANILSYGLQFTGADPLYTDLADIELDWRDAQAQGADLASASLGTNAAQYGRCELEGAYGEASRLIDGLVRGDEEHPPFITTWAAGNERGHLNCGAGYDTTAPPSNAKNPIHVGSIDSDTQSVSFFSSFGPSGDGRLKPTIVAPGYESTGEKGVFSTYLNNTYAVKFGTSMAAPAVAGLSALLIEQFRLTENTDGLPLPSTIKAILIHTAVDLGSPGPDYQTGYGKVDGVKAVQVIQDRRWREGELTETGQVVEYTLTLPEQAYRLRASLAWDDPPAAAAAAWQLVNDLDLTVIGPGGKVTYLPYTLSPWSPDQPAFRAADHLNNQEQVLIDLPQAGTYTVRVRAHTLPYPQRFSLVFGAEPFPAPQLTSVSPQTLLANRGSQSLVLTGSGFNGATSVLWNGTPVPAHLVTRVNSHEIRLAVTAGLVAAPGTVRLTVSNPTPGGGESYPVEVQVVEVLPIYLPVVGR